MTAKKDEKKYVATTGLNYPSTKDGRERRVEAGQPVIDMPPTSLKHELAAGNVVVAGTEENDEKKEGSDQ